MMQERERTHGGAQKTGAKRVQGRSGGRRHAEAGQSMVEYAIVAALIAVVTMATVQALGGGISQVFQNILTRIQSMG